MDWIPWVIFAFPFVVFVVVAGWYHSRRSLRVEVARAPQQWMSRWVLWMQVVGFAAGWVGAAVAVVGCKLPLVTCRAAYNAPNLDSATQVARVDLTMFDFVGLGSTITALAAIGAVFLPGTRYPRGVLAAGVGLLVMLLPLPLQLDAGAYIGAMQLQPAKTPELALLVERFRGCPREFLFGWLGWGVTVAGASLLTLSGVTRLLARPDGPSLGIPRPTESVARPL